MRNKKLQVVKRIKKSTEIIQEQGRPWYRTTVSNSGVTDLQRNGPFLIGNENQLNVKIILIENSLRVCIIVFLPVEYSHNPQFFQLSKYLLSIYLMCKFIRHPSRVER